MICVKSNTAGIFQKITETKKTVKKGEILANILNPLDCSIAEEIKSPVNGTIFFTQSKSLAYANAVLFRIIPEITLNAEKQIFITWKRFVFFRKKNFDLICDCTRFCHCRKNFFCVIFRHFHI